MNAHPLLIAVVIIIAVTILGLLINYFRSRSYMRGYEELAADVQALGRTMRADVFRDGEDLVLNGNYSRMPTVVRFSYSDNTPGLNVSMKAPATFAMWVSPKAAAKAGEGRMLVKTTDEMFDARFTTRTDQPTQAKMFLTGKQAMANLQRLCCSSKTFVTVTKGNVELSELVIPSPYTGRHVVDHLDAMAKLAAALGSMPGADTVKIVPFKSEKSWVTQAAIVVLAITGLVVVVEGIRERQQSTQPLVATTPAAQGPDIPAADAGKIPGLDSWRLATNDDIDPQAVGWLRGSGIANFTGRVTGAFAGAGKPPEAAYLMLRSGKDAQHLHRVVILANSQELIDVAYPSVAAIARVPYDNFSAIQWQPNNVTAPPDGDGLLIVRNAGDMKSGLILYMSNGKLSSGSPLNYQSVPVE